MTFEITIWDVLLFLSTQLLSVVINYGIMLGHFQRRGDLMWDEDYDAHVRMSWLFALPGIFIFPVLLIYTSFTETGIKFKREEDKEHWVGIPKVIRFYWKNKWYYKYLTRDTKREADKYCLGIWASMYKNH